MIAPGKSLLGLLLALLVVPLASAVTVENMQRALLKKGGQAFRAKQFMQAARLWHKAAKLAPSAEVWYRVGVALYKADEAPKAKNALRKALALDPGHAKARRALTRLAPPKPEPKPDPKRGQDPKPPGEGGPADPPKLDRLEDVTIDADEGRAEQAWTDAHRFRKLGDYDQAVGRFVEAYRFGYARAEVDFYLGQALLEDEVLDSALVHLRRAREAVPLDQGICLLLGKAYALRGDSSEQIESLETAVRLDPGYGEAHFQLALAMDLVGDSEGVLEHSQKAIRIDPKYRGKLEDALRDGAVVGRLRDALRATLDGDRGEAPPGEEDLDGYATRLTKLLYPGALPELSEQEPKAPRKKADELALSSRQRSLSARSPALERAKNAGRFREADKTEGLADAFGGAPPPGPSASDDEDFAEESSFLEAPEPSKPSGSLQAQAETRQGPTLAGVQFRLVRQILQDLHEGKGRRAFERVPHAERARFKRDFLAAIRDRPALADLRIRVEAALRES